MAISISEKQHWKERIEKKIKQRIHALKSQSPALFTAAEVVARTTAIESLGIGDDLDQHEKLKSQIEDLENQKKVKSISILERLSGEPVMRGYYSDYEFQNSLDNLLKIHIQKKLEAFLQASPLGREVAKLESEKENLMDTIWLATSSRQMSDMWTKVLKLLDEEGTDFQREILEAPKPAE